MKKRTMALVAAMLLIVGVVIGSTVAWLTAKSETVVNTFTTSDINIKLEETKGTTTDKKNYSFKMVPGYTIEKDPKVTVLPGSEECFLFVKLEKSTDPKFDDYMTYGIAGGWTPVKNVANVYWRKVTAEDIKNSTAYSVLQNDEVTVNTSVTKSNMDTLKSKNEFPKLTITAYASQLYETNGREFSPEKAWENISKN